MGVTGHGRSTAAHKKVQIAALVGLQDMVDIETAVAAIRWSGIQLNVRHATLVLLLGDIQMQSAGVAVQLDPVPIAHDRERPTGREASGATCNTTVP